MKYPPTADSARISEIFSSLQGEGPRAGERHLFIRFEECNIHCQYCDELDKLGIEMSLDSVMQTVSKLEKEEGPHSFVSLTGGEPLIYLQFLKPLIFRLKSAGFKIYLETSGILWRPLMEVIQDCDVIAMDLKPSSVTGERSFLDEHREFLKIARSRETFAKMVLSKDIAFPEFDELIRLVRETAPQIPVILQPVSAEIEGHQDPALMAILAELQRRAGLLVDDVRIVPRLHKILKIR